MTPAKKILFTIAAVTVIAAAVGVAIGYFHLPPTLASAGVGVVIGVGVALGAFSLTPKGTKYN